MSGPGQAAAASFASAASGEPGSRVPGSVELSAEFEIAASTAQKALANLRDTGQVRTELGLGTFIADLK
ncbi:GntR family transcriptional regulator [Streptomyces sp. NPDC055287]